MHSLFLATVCMLCHMSPEVSIDTSLAYRVTANIVQYRLEKDGDLHLILEDSGCTLIAEIPPGSAWSAPFEPTTHWKKWNKRMTVTGILHFDHDHGQKGAAPNNVELHPVISIYEAVMSKTM